MKICIEYDLIPWTAYQTHTQNPHLGRNTALGESENVLNRIVDSTTSKEKEPNVQFSLVHCSAFLNYLLSKEFSSGTGF